MHSFSMTKTIFIDRNRIANKIPYCDSSIYIIYTPSESCYEKINKPKGVKYKRSKVNLSENNHTFNAFKPPPLA